MEQLKKYDKQVQDWIFFKLVFRTLVIILFLFLSTILYIKKNEQKINIAQHYKVEKKYENEAFPVKLKIPSINIDTDLEYVGITSKGEMAVPSNTVNAGWFSLGTAPGQRGTAVIAGHLNGKNGADAVFTNLDQLKKGDKLYIEDGKGRSIVFAVRETRTYDPGYFEEVFSPSDGVYLNLITCGGVWDEVKQSYSKRLVVFANMNPK